MTDESDCIVLHCDSKRLHLFNGFSVVILLLPLFLLFFSMRALTLLLVVALLNPTSRPCCRCVLFFSCCSVAPLLVLFLLEVACYFDFKAGGHVVVVVVSVFRVLVMPYMLNPLTLIQFFRFSFFSAFGC
ncbi:unnamed protein product [Polarella glacialis]|uniref:Transmembrane protein n=1 Tax=Polarella glacialis TaxID=89957 RepID=A0A813ITK1_POLGL|nr:unnamed protein product [Polarella glacialis]